MYNTITENVTRFKSENIANLFIKMIASTKSERIVDYGYDEGNEEPYWVKTAHLITFENYSEEELSRWKACGKFRHD